MTTETEGSRADKGGFKLLSEDDAPAALTLSTRTLQGTRLNGGGPPYVKLGERRIAYSPEALRKWALGRTVRHTSQEDYEGDEDPESHPHK